MIDTSKHPAEHRACKAAQSSHRWNDTFVRHPRCVDVALASAAHVRTGVVFTAGLVVGWLPPIGIYKRIGRRKAYLVVDVACPHWSASELPHSSKGATTASGCGRVAVIGPRNTLPWSLPSSPWSRANFHPVGVDVYYRPQEKHERRGSHGRAPLDGLPRRRRRAVIIEHRGSQRALTLSVDFWKISDSTGSGSSQAPPRYCARRRHRWTPGLRAIRLGRCALKWAKPGTPHSVGGN